MQSTHVDTATASRVNEKSLYNVENRRPNAILACDMNNEIRL